MKIFINIVLLVTMMSFSGFAENSIKKPNVAGQFYSDNPQQLSAQVQRFLNAFETGPTAQHAEIIIVPHAGYVYSGQIAAEAFKYVSLEKYQTIIILAPSHHYAFPGISVWDKGGYETPLGVLKVDEEFAASLINADPLFVVEPKAFEREHALEVELPFIQTAFSNEVKIVPVIMGQASFDVCQKAAQVLHELIGDRKDILVVVSSDMSHFHDDAAARKMDSETIRIIEEKDAKRLWQQCAVRRLEMCGFVPVATAMLLAEARGLQVKVLAYGHSGETTGDTKSVVGYMSAVFYREAGDDISKKDSQQEDADGLSLVHKKKLIAIAKQTIELYVNEKKIFEVEDADTRLKTIEGAFVTIHKHGQLRGCIGHIIGQQPLYLTVRDLAIAAASNDPRFPPVRPDELKDIDVEISVLSEPYRVKSPGEIQIGIHGVIVKRGWQHGVFLPQVATETGWDRETFLSQLCAGKAGLPADAWKDPNTELNIFTATVFSEQEINE